MKVSLLCEQVQMSNMKDTWSASWSNFGRAASAFVTKSGITDPLKWRRSGIWYLGATWFMRWTKPMSSTITNGWLSRTIISQMRKLSDFLSRGTVNIPTRDFLQDSAVMTFGSLFSFELLLL